MNINLNEYLSSYNKLIFSDLSEKKLHDIKELILQTSKNKNKLFVFGNGGSAAIADHFAVDMTKNAGINTLSMNTAAMITCLSNDFGYENWMKKCLEFYGKEGDLVFLISSSGSSMNVINACNFAKNNAIKTVTFSGFNSNNALRESGDTSLWVDSKSYNIVENIHQIWILSLVDLIIGKSEYSAS
jgi:D-sedoheptulose 7-phosphate isomerase